MRSAIPQLLIVFLGGLAALSWQVLWQQDMSLAIGVSEQGAAITVASVMAGMTAGVWWAGRRWRHRTPCHPWLLYGAMELFVGVFAWLPKVCIRAVQHADAAVFHCSPVLATPFYVLALAMTIGPSCFAMGATFPIIALVAVESRRPVSRFYAVNTAGAAAGVMVVTFLLMPNLGRIGSGRAISLTHFAMFIMALVLSRRGEKGATHARDGSAALPGESLPVNARRAMIFATVTGFVTFVLEVSYFRLLRAAWLSTTDSFAAMLFSFLIALAGGAWLSKPLKKSGLSLPSVLMTAAVAIWLTAPLVERIDVWASAAGDYGPRLLLRIFSAVGVIGLAVLPLGIALPWLLDECREPKEWARLYALNTLGCVAGSLVVGWWWLVSFGPVMTCWLAGGVLAVTALNAIPTRRLQAIWILGGAASLAFAVAMGSGIGVTRVQGPNSALRSEHRLLAHVNGPDVTTSVIAAKDGTTVLFIDGYAATGEYGILTHYMDAMGRLPMLLHPSPRNALVICFGTGQTVRGVLDENPKSVTVVDVNPAVFRLSGLFKSNREVLSDHRVCTHVMDGRAWLRRTTEMYDVVTLEPMPPFFAGSNSLYSVEFYQLIRSRLRDHGMVTQWFPLHLLTPAQAHAIVAAFLKTFPEAMLWLDPTNRDDFGNLQQGILVGRKGSGPWPGWPGFSRSVDTPRPLTRENAAAFVLLNAAQLARYAGSSTPVTDDNQLLSFGLDGLHMQNLGRRVVTWENFNELWQLQKDSTRD